jgi:hypothetical protein
MYRVYFDTNEGTEDQLYGLWLPRSAADLAQIPGGPAEGMLITIYMIGEVEMEATLAWSTTWDAWTAQPVAGSVRSNVETWEDHPVTG